jgi:hypothetical protein
MYYLNKQNGHVDVPNNTPSGCAACDCSGNVTLNMLEENVFIEVDDCDGPDFYYWFFVFCVAVFIVAMLNPRRKK